MLVWPIYERTEFICPSREVTALADGNSQTHLPVWPILEPRAHQYLFPKLQPRLAGSEDVLPALVPCSLASHGVIWPFRTLPRWNVTACYLAP